MKLAIVTASVSQRAGGLFQSVRHLSQNLSGDGVEVGVFGLDDDRSERDIAAWLPLEPRTFERSAPRSFGYAAGLCPALRAFAPDVIHLHGLWQFPSIAANRIARELGAPLVISPRGMLDPWAMRHSAWKKRIAWAAYENRTLQNGACLHALCSDEAESMRALGLTPPIAVIPNGVALQSVAGTPPSSPSSSRPKSLLFLGRLHQKKGIRELLEAWAEVRPRGWHLTIAGWDDGGYLNEIESLRQRFSLEESVDIPGPLFGAEKENALKTATAFILPSHSEGLPMAVLEAWSHSLPVLMTDACHLPSGFEAMAAIRIQPTKASIADGLRQLELRTSNDLASMGTRGHDLVRSSFTWDRISHQTIDLYRWLLGSEAPAPPTVTTS